jgi:hypothetical protein
MRVVNEACWSGQIELSVNVLSSRAGTVDFIDLRTPHYLDLMWVPHGVVPRTSDIPHRTVHARGKDVLLLQTLVTATGGVDWTNQRHTDKRIGWSNHLWRLCNECMSCSANFRVKLYRLERSSKTPPDVVWRIESPRLHSDDH